MSFRVPATGIRASGDLYFRRLGADGNLSGAAYKKLRNATQFALQPTSEQSSIKGREIANYNQDLDTLTEAGDFNLSITMNRQDAYNMSIALLGATADINQSAGSLVDDPVDSEAGGSGFLSKRNVTANTVAFKGLDLTVTDSSGFTIGEMITVTTGGAEVGYLFSKPDSTSLFVLVSENGADPGAVGITGATSTATDTVSASTTKADVPTVDTHYTVDSTSGRIDYTDAWPIAGRVLVGADYGAYTGDKITITAETFVKGRLRFEGRNLVNGKRVHCELYLVSLSPNGDLDFMAEDRMQVQLTGRAETPAGFTAPGTLEMFA